MSVAYSCTSIVKNGLKFHVDPANTGKMGSSPYKELTGTTTVTNTDFTEVDSIWRSNADTATGAGTSQLSFSGISVATGSFTMLIWLKVTSNPNVGTNNNYRSVFMINGVSQSPFGILMEQGRDIQFSIATAVTSYRYLGTAFTQYNLTQDVWYQVGFAYDHVLAKGYAYRNGELVRAGNMATSAAETTKATPGEGVTALSSGTTLKISNNNNVSNPNGTGCFPGDVGPAMIYDRSLTTAEIQQNFNAYRGRFGL